MKKEYKRPLTTVIEIEPQEMMSGSTVTYSLTRKQGGNDDEPGGDAEIPTLGSGSVFD